MGLTLPLESTTECPACGESHRVEIAGRPHDAAHSGIRYTRHECKRCRLQFWTPLKADPSVYVDEGFEAYKDYHGGTRPFPRWAEPLFRQLPEHPGKALDIGCGDGAVLARLSAAGFAVSGIDLDEKSIAVALQKHGLLDVSAMTLDAYVNRCRQDEVRFDLVTFFEVLEHQDAPMDFLAQVRSLARSGAIVAGSVPNRERFLAGLDRRLSAGDLPPHHFLWFSRQSLCNLLERSGFVDISIIRTGALPFARVADKLSDVVARKTRSWPASLQLASGPLQLLARIFALVPWIGLRLAPSHLFFRCRAP